MEDKKAALTTAILLVQINQLLHNNLNKERQAGNYTFLSRASRVTQDGLTKAYFNQIQTERSWSNQNDLEWQLTKHLFLWYIHK